MKKNRFGIAKMPFFIVAVLCLSIFACNNENTQTPTETVQKPPAFVKKAPAFNEDSAYYWVQ